MDWLGSLCRFLEVEEGHGLESQETRCREFAKARRYEVTEVFYDKAVSGGLSERPGVLAMLAYLKGNSRGGEISVIIDDISRLARDMRVHGDLRLAINLAGGRLLSRPHYAGYIEVPDWGVSLRKGHHEPLISLEAYNRIQDRIRDGAKAPKTGKKHPYYMCFNKGCGSYRKSVRRDVVEGEFEALLKQMRPSARLFQVVRAAFKRAWDIRLAQANEIKKTLRRDILAIEKQIEQLVDRIVEAPAQSAVAAYERRLAKLERDKAVKAEKLETGGRPQRSFEEMFELAFCFLANPWKLWTSERLEDKRTVLKLAFAHRLAYHRNGGFRTLKTTKPFNVLEALSSGDCKVADGVGFEPTRRSHACRFSRPVPSTARPPIPPSARADVFATLF